VGEAANQGFGSFGTQFPEHLNREVAARRARRAVNVAPNPISRTSRLSSITSTPARTVSTASQRSGMRDNPKVCIEVDQIVDQFHWTTVVASGRYEELSDAAGASLVLERARVVRAEPELVAPGYWAACLGWGARDADRLSHPHRPRNRPPSLATHPLTRHVRLEGPRRRSCLVRAAGRRLA